MTLENIKTQEDLRNYLGNTIIPVPYFLFKIVKSYFQELSFNEIGLSIDLYKVLSEKEDENQNINVPFQYVSKVLDNFKNIPLATIEKYKTKGDSLHFLFEVNNELILQFNEIYKAANDQYLKHNPVVPLQNNQTSTASNIIVPPLTKIVTPY